MQVGDVVKLKSGGPAMTVQSVEGGKAHCSYWNDGEHKMVTSQCFAVASLEVASTANTQALPLQPGRNIS